MESSIHTWISRSIIESHSVTINGNSHQFRRLGSVRPSLFLALVPSPSTPHLPHSSEHYYNLHYRFLKANGGRDKWKHFRRLLLKPMMKKRAGKKRKRNCRKVKPGGTGNCKWIFINQFLSSLGPWALRRTNAWGYATKWNNNGAVEKYSHELCRHRHWQWHSWVVLRFEVVVTMSIDFDQMNGCRER